MGLLSLWPGYFFVARLSEPGGHSTWNAPGHACKGRQRSVLESEPDRGLTLAGHCPASAHDLFGWGVRRRYGFSLRYPFGKSLSASESGTAGTMMQSSPCFQFTGVATL